MLTIITEITVNGRAGLPTFSTDPFPCKYTKIMPIPKDTKKVTHKDYQTRQWPMLQPFPARTEKLERHIVLEKGFRKIQKTTCDFNIHFKKSSKYVHSKSTTWYLVHPL